MTSETVAFTAAKIGGLRTRMGKLTTAARKKIPAGSFALPGRRYPIEDPNHARNALSRVSQHGTPAEKARVRARVHAKYPSIGKRSALAAHVTKLRSSGAFGRG